MRQLDWLGASSGKRSTVLSSTEMKQYAEFDATKCNLLVLGQLILKQGRKGVPINGSPTGLRYLCRAVLWGGGGVMKCQNGCCDVPWHVPTGM